MQKTVFLLLAVLALAAGCSNNKKSSEKSAETADTTVTESKFLNEPLVEHIFTADPSAHVFDGKIFIYPSHDIDAGIPDNDLGDQYAMRDYHVFSMDQPGGVGVGQSFADALCDFHGGGLFDGFAVTGMEE